ncbi:hypothetical protein ACT2CR_00070 [Candidatus Vidania fulgoroideorum]
MKKFLLVLNSIFKKKIDLVKKNFFIFIIYKNKINISIKKKFLELI